MVAEEIDNITIAVILSMIASFVYINYGAMDIKIAKEETNMLIKTNSRVIVKEYVLLKGNQKSRVYDFCLYVKHNKGNFGLLGTLEDIITLCKEECLQSVNLGDWRIHVILKEHYNISVNNMSFAYHLQDGYIILLRIGGNASSQELSNFISNNLPEELL